MLISFFATHWKKFCGKCRNFSCASFFLWKIVFKNWLMQCSKHFLQHFVCFFWVMFTCQNWKHLQKKIKTWPNDGIAIESVDNIVGKGQNADCLHLLFFPTMLSDSLYLKVVNSLPPNHNFKRSCIRRLWKRGKRRKCWWPSFSPFPTVFSTLPKTSFTFSVIFILSAANIFILDQSKSLLFGKEL